MCGAAAATDATLCEHCGARLATVACPACFGMMFLGQKFCPHCGAKADRTDASEPGIARPCPRCQTNLEAVKIGLSDVQECPHCEGIWLDAETLRQICADQEKQAAVLGLPSPPISNECVNVESQVRYLHCPVCAEIMNRVNFAGYSTVIVDVCREHGTWFDRDELRRIVEFIRAGGLDKARQREIENLNLDRRLASLDRSMGHSTMRDVDVDPRGGAIAGVARFLFDLLS